jgi:pyruvate dehydrogenase E2 component (dihydrolipoamide acetyltransferase)
MYEVKMPKLGMAQSWCVIEKWHKKPGDEVKRGDVIVEVSTDKISYEVESEEDGTLLKILKNEGEEAPVSETIAIIGSKSDFEEIETGKNFITAQASEKKQENIISQDFGKRDLMVSEQDLSVVKISALAKNIAESKNIDISKVKGTGPGGRILKEDVEAYIKALGQADQASLSDMPDNILPQKKGLTDTGKPLEIKIHSSSDLSRLRRIIAEKMTYSQQNIPHISQTAKAIIEELVSVKEKLQDESQKLSFTDFFIKAAAMALRDNLNINSSLIGGKHIIYKDINIGLVNIIPGGLVIPVIKNCDIKTVAEISGERRSLNKKAMENKLDIEDISNGTFTISNLGAYKIKSFTAIIYPPQGSILSIGSIYESPEIADNRVVIRKVVELTAAQDHRIIDGAEGAKFLTDMIRFLENPEMLFEK